MMMIGFRLLMDMAKGHRYWMSAAALFGLVPPLGAATYYVSPSGNDAGPGSQTQPFASPQTAVTHLAPGDTLVFRQGTYYGSIIVPQSGSAASPITLEAYPGETPLLDGAGPVTGAWSHYQSSIYRAPWASQPAQVFCDGHLLNEARWPAAEVEGLSHQPVALADSGSASQVTCANLPRVDLTGALIQLMAGQSWCSYTRTIVSHDRPRGSLVFDSPVSEMAALVPRRGTRFYVFGKLNLLTAPGEWYWDPQKKELYAWTPDGAPPQGRVEAGDASPVLSLDGQSYITVKGLQARGGWFSLSNSSHCTVQDCRLIAPNWTRMMNGYVTKPATLGGIDISGADNQCLGGSVVFAGRSGVDLSGGSGHLVKGMNVEDCGWNWGNDGGIHVIHADQCVVQSCTVRRVARVGIFDYYSTSCRFLNNLVEDVCLYSDDVGNFDSWGTDGKGSEIAYNLMRGNRGMWGAGIYLDDNAKGFNVHDNVVEDCAWYGFKFSDVDRLENNTALGPGHGALYCSQPASKDLTGSKVAHNRFRETFPVRVNFNQASVTDYGYYGGYAYLGAPGRVEVDWGQLEQPWWAVKVPLDLTQIPTIAFSIECLADSFTFTVANLRLLPKGLKGDDGAVTLAGNWFSYAGQGATSTLSLSGPATWGATGKTVVGGWNSTGLPLTSSQRDLTAYRGLAFEIGGTAVMKYNLNGCVDEDNGPDPKPGRGASPPITVGAEGLRVGPVP